MPPLQATHMMSGGIPAFTRLINSTLSVYRNDSAEDGFNSLCGMCSLVGDSLFAVLQFNKFCQLPQAKLCESSPNYQLIAQVLCIIHEVEHVPREEKFSNTTKMLQPRAFSPCARIDFFASSFVHPRKLLDQLVSVELQCYHLANKR